MLIQSCKSTQSSFNYEKLLWTTDWSPNKELIAVGGNWDTLQILSANDLEVVKSYKMPRTITKTAWHKSGEIIAVTSQISKDVAVLIDKKTDKITKLEHVHQHGARGLSWNNDGSLLAIGDNSGHLTLFDREGNFIKKIDLKQKAITGLSWHPTQNIIVAVGSQISIYDLDNDQLKTIVPRDVEILMLCVEWHPSGNFFVTGDYGDFEKEYPPLLQFWKDTGENIKDVEESKAEYRNLKWTSDGKILATSSEKIRLWNTDGELLKSRSLGKSLLWGIDWNSDNTKIVITNENGDIKILNQKLKIVLEKENN